MRTVLACLVLASMGCAILRAEQVKQERAAAQANWGPLANREMACSDRAECDAMWSTAIAEIAKRSSFRFQQQTDFLLSTFCGQQGDSSLCYEGTRQLLGNGTGRIELSIYCRAIYGCVPNETRTKAELVSAVLATKGSPKP